MQVELLNRKRWNNRIELANAMFECLEVWHDRHRRHSTLGLPVTRRGRDPEHKIVAI
jgi:putative transposase